MQGIFKIGIYKITNIINKKIYVGQVGKDKETNLDTRYKDHIWS